MEVSHCLPIAHKNLRTTQKKVQHELDLWTTKSFSSCCNTCDVVQASSSLWGRVGHQEANSASVNTVLALWDSVPGIHKSWSVVFTKLIQISSCASIEPVGTLQSAQKTMQLATAHLGHADNWDLPKKSYSTSHSWLLIIKRFPCCCGTLATVQASSSLWYFPNFSHPFFLSFIEFLWIF